MSKVGNTTVVRAGRYTIRAGMVSGKPKAFIFLGTEKIAGIEFSEPSLDETVSAAKFWVNTETMRMLKGRRAGNIATQDEYEQYFKIHGASDHERDMLRFHAAQVNATMGEIADSVGWEYSAGNLHYGTLGAKIASELNLAPAVRTDGSEIGISAIGNEGIRGENGHYVLSMHPELIAALLSVGIAR